MVKIYQDIESIALNEEDLPLTNQDWEKMETLAFDKEAAFEDLSVGDTDENLRLHCSRFLIPQNKVWKNALSDFLCSQAFIKCLTSWTGVQHLFIHRCQSHIYQQGDWLGRHNDLGSNGAYLYSSIFSFSSNYRGGDLVVYDKEGCPHKIRIKWRSLFLMNSKYDHEVTPITAGLRKVLVFFLKGSPAHKTALKST